MTDAFLAATGNDRGLDVDRRDAARAARHATNARRGQSAADRLGVQSTPSFFVRRGDGELQPLKVSEPDAGRRSRRRSTRHWRDEAAASRPPSLALAGVGVAGYLTWVHYAGLQAGLRRRQRRL